MTSINIDLKTQIAAVVATRVTNEAAKLELNPSVKTHLKFAKHAVNFTRDSIVAVIDEHKIDFASIFSNCAIYTVDKILSCLEHVADKKASIDANVRAILDNAKRDKDKSLDFAECNATMSRSVTCESAASLKTRRNLSSNTASTQASYARSALVALKCARIVRDEENDKKFVVDFDSALTRAILA